MMNRPRPSRRELLLGAACGILAHSLGGELVPAVSPASCVFCDIIAGRRAAAVVYGDDRCLAFGSIEPLQPGHLLLVPRRHAENLFDLPEDDAAHLLPVAGRLSRALREVFHADGLTCLQNSGKASGQSVLHYHMHLIPRHDGVELFRRVVDAKKVEQSELENALAPVRESLQRS